MAPQKEIDIEKPFDMQVENAAVDEKQIESKGDYSGAVKKTSPEEIKLVRKLDIRIMTILWCMYFLVSLFLSMFLKVQYLEMHNELVMES